MRQLSLTDTQNLVAKLTKSLGERGAARALNKAGYLSPEGREIRQGHISRIQSGSWTCLLAPDTPPEAVEIGPGKITGTNPIEVEGRPGKVAGTAPKADYAIGEAYPEHCLERGPSTSGDRSISANASGKVAGSVEELEDQDPREVRRRLREELLTQEADRKEKEENAPPLVPAPGDHARAEHSNVQRFARPAAVFNRRQAVEIETDSEGNEECYFGIPKLKHRPPVTMSRPYLAKSYGGNVVSTR